MGPCQGLIESIFSSTRNIVRTNGWREWWWRVFLVSLIAASTASLIGFTRPIPGTIIDAYSNRRSLEYYVLQNRTEDLRLIRVLSYYQCCGLKGLNKDTKEQRDFFLKNHPYNCFVDGATPPANMRYDETRGLACLELMDDGPGLVNVLYFGIDILLLVITWLYYYREHNRRQQEKIVGVIAL
ncbi:unnamed protein product [Didymodactylos carnosus]|uniref:Uncharacterized protein n=1 Tax=Didymodactylos carnosus TaxID=1234261 RepID=A0A8S2ECV8_9BILA|nr:unnamed protein product [Didymodactylos carnosus]CAF4001218.1 unnamed protein product [Didymodactylos carnosus]